MKKSNRQACLYVVELEHADHSWVKVGMTTNRIARFSALQNGCPIDYSRLYFANVYNEALLELAESSAHVAMGDRAHRAEWFTGKADHATLGKIAVACALHGIEIEWEECLRTSITASASIKRSEKALAKERRLREERAENEIARIRHAAEYQPTMRDISSAYRKPLLKLKSS